MSLSLSLRCLRSFKLWLFVSFFVVVVLTFERTSKFRDSIQAWQEVTVRNTFISTGDPLTSIIDGSLLSNTSEHNASSTPTHLESPSNITDAPTMCPAMPPNLIGRRNVSMLDHPMDDLEHFNTRPGGRWTPPHCTSRHRVAIVVPFRDRPSHLRIFLQNLHTLLQIQELDYGIYIVEPIANQTFNRAKLMNVGYTEAMKDSAWECFIFHDVDLVPEDDRNLYTCADQPRHMSAAIDLAGYKLPYEDIFGGVSALTTEQLRKVNGFSNDFWGYGGEDDEMFYRVRHHGYRVIRYPLEIARYKMIKHVHESSNPLNNCRYQLIYAGAKRQHRDGLNSLRYRVVDARDEKLYRWLLVDLDEEEGRAKLAAENVCTSVPK